MRLADIGELTPYEKNSRTHSAKQVAGIRKSIEAFGMVGAIVVRDGVIAKGHATFAAVKRIYKDGELLYPAPGESAGIEPYPAGRVPVLDVSGWTDDQFRAYVIADNRVAEQAGWDKALLAEEMQEIFDVDLSEMLAELDIDEILKISPMSQTFEAGKGGEDYFGEPEEDGEPDYRNSKYPITFTLTSEEYGIWCKVKENYPSINYKKVFLRGQNVD